MSQIVTNQSGAIDGEKLSHLIELHLRNAVGDRLGTLGDGEPGADLLLSDLFTSELTEIATLNPGSVPSAAMWMMDCAIACSAVTLTEAPPKAIQLVAEEVSKLREDLEDVLKDARQDAARPA